MSLCGLKSKDGWQNLRMSMKWLHEVGSSPNGVALEILLSKN